MCPFCNAEIKCDFRLIFTHRCKICNKNLIKPHEKKYKIFSGLSVAISILLFTLISSIGEIYINNNILREFIAVFISFFLLCVFQFLIVKKVCSSYKCDDNR